MERAAGEGCSEVKKVLKKNLAWGWGTKESQRFAYCLLNFCGTRELGALRESELQSLPFRIQSGPVCFGAWVTRHSCIAGGAQGVRSTGLTLHSGPEALQSLRLYGLGAPRGIPPHI